MNEIEDYLQCTTEIDEDYSDGWLPTLDTSFKVGKDNLVIFKYFEKETSSRQTVQQQSVMSENTRIQVLSNDNIRRLLNSS